MRDDPWFSGFAAGEGCFWFSRLRRRNECQPRFTIGLRKDDEAILRELQAEFGGSVRVEDRGKSPLARWTVMSKDDLGGLVEYFDRFPLRAKKALDYGIWRDGVEIYRESTGLDPRLMALRAILVFSRPLDVAYLGKHPEDWLELA